MDATERIYHNVRFGLNELEEYIKEICQFCLQVQKNIQDLKSVVSTTDISGSALPTLKNCYERAVLFMGHRIRVFNQHSAIQQMFDGMKNKCEIEGNCHEAVVVTDSRKEKKRKIFLKNNN